VTPHYSIGTLAPCTEGDWMIMPPKLCPNGHNLGPNRPLVWSRVGTSR
jgi:hypothetical protein